MNKDKPTRTVRKWVTSYRDRHQCYVCKKFVVRSVQMISLKHCLCYGCYDVYVDIEIPKHIPYSQHEKYRIARMKKPDTIKRRVWI